MRIDVKASATHGGDQYNGAMGKVWWVNQKEKLRGRVANEIVWSPHGEPGSEDEQWHWRTMWNVERGDIIIHYSQQYIVAISTALTSAIPAKNPYADDETWIKDGKQITVDIHWLEVPIAKGEIPLTVRQAAYENQGPFQKSGERVKQGYFFPVSSELWQAIKEIAGLAQDQTKQDIRGKGLSFSGASDVARIISARKEQTWLRGRLLAGRDEASCEICGRSMPSRYLHAAHIKKRSNATEKERSDPNIAMLACVLGCDQAFESGDIRVGEDGIISLRDQNDAFLSKTFGYLVGRQAPAHNPNTAGYFKAHEEAFSK